MANEQNLVVLHCIPGRVRLGGALLHRDAPRAERVARAAGAIAGVIGARANPWAASLVIEYDASVPLSEILRRLSESVELAALGVQRIEREWPSRGSVGSPARTVEAFLHTASRLNAASASVAPAHVDLKIVVPGVVFGYGLLRLLSARYGPTPHWIVFLMYGFDLFSALNQGTIRRFVDGVAGVPTSHGAPS
jgi:hypothetical protein